MRFMLEDSIMVKDQVCTAGSSILYNFKAPFSAAVYEKCVANGMEFTGSVVSDEFGIDNLFDDSDPLAAPVAALLEDQCDVVFCNDVFGKLRRQAPGKGLIYIHPAYGTVSRYGLIPSISSMDQIGVLCRNIQEGMEALSVISGHDERDGTSLPREIYTYDAKEPLKTIGVPSAFDSSFLTGVQRVNVELKYFDVLAQIFYILGSAEISNNTNRYDGVKFGLRANDAHGVNDLYIKTRSEGLGRDAQLASLVGCMVLSQEHYEKLYHKSMQIRGMVKSYYSGLLSQVDAIVLPVQPGGDKYRQSAAYALAVLCGFPAVSFTAKSSAYQFITARGRENAVFSYAQEVLQ